MATPALSQATVTWLSLKETFADTMPNRTFCQLAAKLVVQCVL